MVEYVIANCRTGFGNRIKDLISAMKIADKLSAQLILCWHKDIFVKYSFSDFFENKIPEIEPEDISKLVEKKQDKYKIVSDSILAILPDENLPKNFSKAWPSTSRRSIDGEYDRIPLPIRDNFIIYIRKLIPKKSIVETVDDFAHNFSDDTIGMSIRSWSDCKEFRGALFSLQNIYQIIEKTPQAKFFISSDSQEVFEKIVSKYGKRILYYHKKFSLCDSNSPEGARDAFIDLLLLARLNQLKAPWLSSFSEMAWWLGCCKASVEVIPRKKHFLKIFEIYPNHIVAYCLFGRWYAHYYKSPIEQMLIRFYYTAQYKIQACFRRMSWLQ